MLGRKYFSFVYLRIKFLLQMESTKSCLKQFIWQINIPWPPCTTISQLPNMPPLPQKWHSPWLKFRDSAKFKIFLKYYYYFKFYNLTKTEVIFAPWISWFPGHSEKQFPHIFIFTGFPHQSLEIPLDRGVHDWHVGC